MRKSKARAEKTQPRIPPVETDAKKPQPVEAIVAGQLVDPIKLLENLDAKKLDEEIDRLQNELASLKILQRALKARDGQLPKKTTRRKAGSTPRETNEAAEATLFRRIAQYLENGTPTISPVIAVALDESDAKVRRIMGANPQRFKRLANAKWMLKGD